MKKIISGTLILFFIATAGYCQDQNQPIRLIIKSDKQVYEVGGAISISENLTNVSGQSIKVSDYYKPTNQGFYIFFLLKNEYGQKCEINISDQIRATMPVELAPGQSINVTGATISLPNGLTKYEKYKIAGRQYIYITDGGLTSNTITIKMLGKEKINPDPIKELVEELGSTYGLWVNGIYGGSKLPPSATIEQVVSEFLHRTQFDQGNTSASVTNYKILHIKEVQIPPSTERYMAVLVQTNLGKKIVLLGQKWLWVRAYDVEEDKYF